MAKMGLIKRTGPSWARRSFFAKLIIITGLIPIFAFQKVEGKLFSPLAYTPGVRPAGAP